jgi:hypothetical protein
MENNYIVTNLDTLKSKSFATRKQAEDFAVLACSKDESLLDFLVVSRVSHKVSKVGTHFETVFLHVLNDLSNYSPQKGDAFRKIKSYKSKSANERYLVREIKEVTGDYVVFKNFTGDEEEPDQIMPVKQWKRWIIGAEFIKRGDELLCDF